MLGLGRQGWLEKRDVAQVAGGRGRLRGDVGHLGRLGVPRGRVVARRLCLMVSRLHHGRAGRGRGAEDPASEALAETAAHVGHALPQASVQR